MAGSIKGITIEIGGNTTPLQKALKDVNSSSASLKTELREVERLLKLDPSNTTLLAQKQELLGKQVETTKEKLERLKSVEEQVEQQFADGEIDEGQYRAFQRELAKTEAELKKVETQSSEAGDEVQDAGKKAAKSGEDAESGRSKWESFGEGLKKVATAAAEAAAAATAAIAAAAVKLGKEVVSAYADYEQLTGGVETLFKDSSDIVMKYAENAYKTAGLSANEYMETVTGFSASLISSLGGDTEKAAKYADMAITDMSDNANKMGSDMQSIQNAYAGFAKGQFNMLDNLKLGYGGTKEEMERLLADAQAISGIEYNIDSYADVVDAIHVIQTEMGIAGTTAKEAEATISGSIGMLKSSFSNLIIGLGNDKADLDGLINNVVDSFKSVVENVTPIVNNLAKVLPDAIKGMVQAAAPLLPSLLKTGTQIFESLLEGIIGVLPELMTVASDVIMTLVNGIIASLPVVIEAAATLITTLIQGIAEAIPELVPTIVEVVLTFANTLVENLPTLLEAVLQIIEGLALGIIEAMPIIIETLPEIITGIVDALTSFIPQIIRCGITIFVALVENLPAIIEGIVAALPEIIDSVIEGFVGMIPQLVDCGVKLFVALIQNLPKILVEVGKAVPKIVTSLVSGFKTLFSSLAEVGAQLFGQLIARGGEILSTLGSFVSGLMSNVISILSSWFSSFSEIGYNIVSGIWSGLSAGWGWLTSQVSNLASSLLNAAKNALGIHSPSTKFRDEIGKMMAAGIGEGFDVEIPKTFSNVKSALKTQEAKLASSVTNSTTHTVNNSTSLGGIAVYITGNVGNVGEARKIGDAVAEEVQRRLRYKGVLSLA